MTTSSASEVENQGMWIIGYGSLIFKPPQHSFRVNGYLKGFIRRFWQSSSDHRGTPEAPGRVVTLVSLDDLKTNVKFHNDLHLYELRSTHQETEIKEGKESTPVEPIDSISHRVSTLEVDDLKVWGVAYYIEPKDVAEVKAYLDVREQDGYTTHKVPFHIINVENKNDVSEKVLADLPKDSLTGDFLIDSMIYIGTVDSESFIGPESVHETAKKIKSSQGPSGLNSEYLFELTKAVRHLDKENRSRDYYLEDLVKLVNDESL
ncbi:ChaC-like protein [Scheffersomyces xylosifermentans]|uniref:ChaC-like protein n=1 Tax=Scheffersomyces xylosifermentans TaxID=1304137 RepID=UPI00315CC43B